MTQKQRSGRIELKFLKKLVELRLELDTDESTYIDRIYDEGYGSEIYEIISKMYGSRIFKHQHQNQFSAHLELLLESLVESGDVIKTNPNELYKATGKALSTIAHYEEENRRHRQQMRMNFLMVILTTVIAISSVITWFKDKGLNP